jgi:molecular chaperone HtpG
MDLQTEVEKSADLARHLPAFSGLSLPDVRKNVAEMLGLIGRVEGIFATYTRHDISHIDKMLGMLDWLIPERTAAVMTPIDWLAIVLAIYLHDLGMLVTAEEFRDRQKNAVFAGWQRGLSDSSDGRVFLDRTGRMSEGQRDRFFFEEYIRKGHATRVREWITGRHSRSWGGRQRRSPVRLGTC